MTEEKKPGWFKRVKFLTGILWEVAWMENRDVMKQQLALGATQHRVLQIVFTDWGKRGKSMFIQAKPNGKAKVRIPGINCFRGPKIVDTIAYCTIATFEGIIRRTVTVRDQRTGEIITERVSIQQALRLASTHGRLTLGGDMSWENLSFVLNAAGKFQNEVDAVVGTVDKNIKEGVAYDGIEVSGQPEGSGGQDEEKGA